MSSLSKATRNAQIEAAYKGGTSVAALASEFDLSQTRVRQILSRREHARRTIKRRLVAPLRHSR